MGAMHVSSVVGITTLVANFAGAVTLTRHSDVGVNFCRLWFFSPTTVFFRDRRKDRNNSADSAFFHGLIF